MMEIAKSFGAMAKKGIEYYDWLSLSQNVGNSVNQSDMVPIECLIVCKRNHISLENTLLDESHFVCLVLL